MLIYQGFILRRINPKYHYFLLLSGIFLNIPSFVVIAFAYTAESLYFGLIPYAYSSAIVIPTLTTLISSFGPPNQKGVLLGIFRSIGALARALGPLTMSFGEYKILFDHLCPIDRIILHMLMISLFLNT